MIYVVRVTILRDMNVANSSMFCFRCDKMYSFRLTLHVLFVFFIEDTYMAEFSDITTLNVTCTMLGTKPEVFTPITQLSHCGTICFDSTPCIAWSWTEDRICVLCHVYDPLTWTTKQQTIPSDNVIVQYLVYKTRELAGNKPHIRHDNVITDR